MASSMHIHTGQALFESQATRLRIAAVACCDRLKPTAQQPECIVFMTYSAMKRHVGRVQHP
eukprot:6286-Heterococcus_DN1.PRE.3